MLKELPNTSTPEWNIRRAEINKLFTEYKIKEVSNIIHAERIQRSPEMVF